MYPTGTARSFFPTKGCLNVADLTLAEALSRLETLGDRIAKQCEDVMKSVTPVGRTGNLKKSIYHRQEGADTWFIGTDIYYASWVENGRGEVTPKKTAYSIRTRTPRTVPLRWIDYDGDINSVHHGKPGAVVYAMRSRKSTPNPFVGRAKRIIDQMTFTL